MMHVLTAAIAAGLRSRKFIPTNLLGRLLVGRTELGERHRPTAEKPVGSG
ncbi:hypothetical protein GCM10010307_20820 [Streptomyces vastus]|uniref:Uncharacterized protein n=1 Tax=Streptomyces vastus TaxID=285451 RepID=A0ABP6CZ58_9ACTN